MTLENYGATYHVRTEARLILPLKQLTPINVGKEMMRLDLRGTAGTQTALGITIKEP